MTSGEGGSRYGRRYVSGRYVHANGRYVINGPIVEGRLVAIARRRRQYVSPSRHASAGARRRCTKPLDDGNTTYVRRRYGDDARGNVTCNVTANWKA